MQTIAFGTHVRDIITGQTGTVTGYTTYITGCDQYLIQPGAKPDGTPSESVWRDVARLKPTGATIDPEIAALVAAQSSPDRADGIIRGADLAAPSK